MSNSSLKSREKLTSSSVEGGGGKHEIFLTASFKSERGFALYLAMQPKSQSPRDALSAAGVCPAGHKNKLLP